MPIHNRPYINIPYPKRLVLREKDGEVFFEVEISEKTEYIENMPALDTMNPLIRRLMLEVFLKEHGAKPELPPTIPVPEGMTREQMENIFNGVGPE